MSEVSAAMRPLKTGKMKTGYLASLDGWRAIAILGVMMTHDRAWNLFGHSSQSYMGYGGDGIYLFFAISGFLIATRILEEESMCGRFEIGRFYVRRIFRIQPAALAFLVFIAVLMLAGLARGGEAVETRHDWLAALLLYTNFIYHPGDTPTLTGHFWTLAVEEHFYILLSLAMVLLRRGRTAVLCLLALAALVLYFAQDPLSHRLCHFAWYPCETPRATQWQLSMLFAAAAVAAIVRVPRIARAVRRVLQPWVAVLLVTPLIAVLHNLGDHVVHHAHIAPLQGLPSQAGFVLTFLPILWVVATVFHPQSLATRFLETRPLRFVGRISYSLYLWHVAVNYLWKLLLFNDGGPMSHVHIHWLHSLLERPARVATSFAVATASYYWLEKPLIRLGHKLAPPATPGRPELADLPVETRGGDVAATA